ncbi:NAD(P)/FAD-dependent oxidoreductase [Brevibacillus choshinensis]|uniref:NAD(P)/FAD-dependent oxidoreductase n=1 Tax=Brevibacillus choshinensis TaxID=54911 RepID=UPI002E1FB632|nr:NAD(P)/FAD-dependent oxidoreductase [Brevibacillus choshinensis]
MKVDVAIIGSGPAGLAASIELARSGLSVAIVDEYYRPGGRLLGQLYDDPHAPVNQRRWDGKKVATELVEQARTLGVTILCGATVWSVSPGWQIELSGSEEKSVYAKAVLLATGAAEKALPMPGWTLPGVFSVGAAQTFTNVHRVAIGKRVMVVGIDPLALSVAMEMKHAGIDVIGVAMAPRSPMTEKLSSPIQALSRLGDAAALAPNLFLRTIGRLTAGSLSQVAVYALSLPLLQVDGIPVHIRKAVTKIEGEQSVEAVILQAVSAKGEPTGREERVEVDAVCLSAGLYPLIELAQVAGCSLTHIPELGGMVPLYGKDLSTTAEGLYVAGNITGIEGAKVAMAQGKLAAVSIVQTFGKTPSLTKEEAIQAVEQARALSPIQFFPQVQVGLAKMEQLWCEAWLQREGEQVWRM